MTTRDIAPDLDKAAGVLIRTARLTRGLTLAQLGKEIGIRYQQIQKYESGQNRMALTTFFTICGALGISPGDTIATMERKRKSAPVADPPGRDVLELLAAYHALPTDAAKSYARTSVRHLAIIAGGDR